MAEAATAIKDAGLTDQYDADLLVRARDEVKRRKLTISAFADELGYSSSLMSRYLDGSLTSPTNAEERLRAYFTRQERRGLMGGFVWTEVAESVFQCLEYARERKKFVVIHSRSGMGKTTAAVQYLDRQERKAEGKKGFAMVTCSPVTTTRTLVQKIAVELREQTYGATDAILDRIIAKLINKEYLLIIDDASHLSVKSLEVLRRIYDAVPCGLVLMGVRTLMERILVADGRVKEELEQLYTRVDINALLDSNLSGKDVEKMAKGRITRLAESHLKFLNSKPRTSRELTKIIDRAEWLAQHNSGVPYEKLLARAESDIFRAA